MGALNNEELSQLTDDQAWEITKDFIYDDHVPAAADTADVGT